MRIFISWSGPRSQVLAQALHEWLPLVAHYVQPWLSQSDIEAGDRWANEIAKELEASNFGIICVTRENASSPWILFEAGALAKLMQDGRVIPLLLDIEFKDISGPLAQFQSKKVEKDGIRDVITAINKLAPQAIPDTRLLQLFEMLWTAFESKLASLPKPTTVGKQNRPQHEILEELVTSIRGLDIRLRDDGDPRARKRRRAHPMIARELAHMSGEKPSSPLSILMMASMLREEVPWLYELAAELYRTSSYGRASKDVQLA